MLKLKIKLSINDEIHEYKMDLYDTEVIPDNDFILNDYSAHYHISNKRAMPTNSKVVSVEEV